MQLLVLGIGAVLLVVIFRTVRAFFRALSARSTRTRASSHHTASVRSQDLGAKATRALGDASRGVREQMQANERRLRRDQDSQRAAAGRIKDAQHRLSEMTKRSTARVNEQTARMVKNAIRRNRGW